jgi:phosphohistidine phosphatase
VRDHARLGGAAVKTVYLLRHAKSSWDQPSLPDHDRPLAPRGETAAPVMGRHLAEAGLVPERVLCSTAVRARQTWQAVASALSPAPEVAYRRDIYDADAGDLLRVLRELPDDVGSVMLVGHNPAMEELAAMLVGGGDDAARQRMASKFPTAALAQIAMDVASWSAITPGRGRLDRFVRPKEVG